MVLLGQRWLSGAAWAGGLAPCRMLPKTGAEGGCLQLPASSLCTVCCCDPDRTLLPQAAQNLIVLAREEAGAEKIFQSDGVRLLMQLLDTAKADLMLAALRTLVGLCSGHRSRVGPTIPYGWAQGKAMLGRLQRVRQGSSELLPARPELVRGNHPDKGLRNAKASPRPPEDRCAYTCRPWPSWRNWGPPVSRRCWAWSMSRCPWLPATCCT